MSLAPAPPACPDQPGDQRGALPSGWAERLDLRFHHLGLAVPEPQAAWRFLALLGYTAGRQVFDPRQKVNLAMRHHPAMPDVEVIWPGPEPSPIDVMIRRHGTLIYHCCYETADPEAAIRGIEAAGLWTSLVSPPSPAVLFDGLEVSFYQIDDVGLIELLRVPVA